jgi:hypothetical protein
MRLRAYGLAFRDRLIIPRHERFYTKKSGKGFRLKYWRIFESFGAAPLTVFFGEVIAEPNQTVLRLEGLENGWQRTRQ